MTTQQVLKVSHPRDVLAYVSYSLGYRPRDSMVVLCLRGPRRRIGASMRFDLPAADPEMSALMARSVAVHAAADGASAAVLVVYAERGGGGRLPAQDLVDEVITALEVDGIDVMDAWQVDDDVYRSYRCQDRRCCPADGRPVGETSSSAVASAMVLEGCAVIGDGEEALLGDLTPADDDVAARVEAARRAASRGWHREGSGTARRRRRRTHALEEWQRALEEVTAAGEGDAERPESLRDVAERVLDDAGCGRLLAALQDVTLRDAVMLTVAPDAGDAPRLLAGSAPASDGVAPEVVAALESVFGGQETGAAPERLRCDAIEELLRVLVRRARPGRRVAALALLGWLAWYRGDGGRSRVLVARALADRPGYPLAQLVDDALLRGVAPGWVVRRRALDLAAAVESA